MRGPSRRPAWGRGRRWRAGRRRRVFPGRRASRRKNASRGSISQTTSFSVARMTTRVTIAWVMRLTIARETGTLNISQKEYSDRRPAVLFLRKVECPRFPLQSPHVSEHTASRNDRLA
jgi:hypothetical protein